VLTDADFDSAVEGSLNAWLFNHGQCCVCGYSSCVEDTIFEKFTEAVAHAASQVKIGPGLDPTTQLGPIGYFVEPTVFVDVKPDFSIVQEEIFGPVVAALPFNADDGQSPPQTFPSTSSRRASGLATPPRLTTRQSV